MAKICESCGGKAKGKKKIKVGFICSDCYVKSNLEDVSNLSSQDIKERLEYLESNRELFDSFDPTIKIGKVFYVDEDKKLFRIRKNKECFRFDEVINFELNEDGESISSGGIGKAVAGGMLFGGVGAIVGGATGKRKQKAVVNNMYIRLSLNHRWIKHYKIDLISMPSKKSGLIYKGMKQFSDEIVSALEMMTAQNNSNEVAATSTPSAADEILKFKELLDVGAITQDEFDEKKKQLLDQ